MKNNIKKKNEPQMSLETERKCLRAKVKNTFASRIEKIICTVINFQHSLFL